MRIVLVLTMLALAGCATSDDGERTYDPIESISDVHGIAVNPEEPQELFIATHHGLIRYRAGDLTRVGSMQDDLMGFSMHPTNGSTFWTSGHPRGGGNMGVRQSTDGGFTWTTLWSERVDFHAMAVSPVDPDHVWGVWRGEIKHSTDGGRTWESYANAPQALSLAPDPTAATTIYAATATGIQRSTDAGRTWAAFASIKAASIALDASAGTIFAGTENGVAKSTDAGKSWAGTSLATRSPVGYLARDPSAAGTIYAAAYDASVYRSTDGGSTWTTLVESGRVARAG